MKRRKRKKEWINVVLEHPFVRFILSKIEVWVRVWSVFGMREFCAYSLLHKQGSGVHGWLGDLFALLTSRGLLFVCFLLNRRWHFDACVGWLRIVVEGERECLGECAWLGWVVGVLLSALCRWRCGLTCVWPPSLVSALNRRNGLTCGRPASSARAMA